MPKQTNKRNGPHPVDIHVGSRVRMRRTLLGMSQEKLSDALGLTFQQVQKYENGANRISSSRLFEISRVMDVEVSFFFEEMPAEVTAPDDENILIFPAEETKDPLMKRETLELVRAYYRITDPRVRKRVFELAKAIAGQSDSDDTETDAA